MPSPNAVFTEMVATTFRLHSDTFSDNVTNHNAYISYATKNGRKRLEDGGLTIVQGIEYAENSTYTRYDGYDELPTNASDVLSDAEFEWRNSAVFIGTSGDRIRKNSGKSRIMNLVKSQIRNGINTFKNNVSVDAYSDGSLTKQVNGIQALVSDTGLGTVGGIPAATFPFWRNVVQSAAAPIQGGGAITPSATTMESLMLPAYLETERGTDHVKIIVASNDYYSFYEQSQTSIKRYMNTSEADGGFLNLQYHDAMVIHDGGSGIPSSRMYGLNTDYLEIVVHKDADMVLTDEIRPQNQDAVGQWLLMMWQLTVSNRSLQFVIKP